MSFLHEINYLMVIQKVPCQIILPEAVTCFGFTEILTFEVMNSDRKMEQATEDRKFPYYTPHTRTSSVAPAHAYGSFALSGICVCLIYRLVCSVRKCVSGLSCQFPL